MPTASLQIHIRSSGFDMVSSRTHDERLAVHLYLEHFRSEWGLCSQTYLPDGPPENIELVDASSCSYSTVRRYNERYKNNFDHCMRPSCWRQGYRAVGELARQEHPIVSGALLTPWKSRPWFFCSHASHLTDKYMDEGSFQLEARISAAAKRFTHSWLDA